MKQPYYAETDEMHFGQTVPTNIQNTVRSIFVTVNATAWKAMQETDILQG
jgi:hypothetical protein